MNEQKKFNERLNIKVPAKILTNKELSENEKLILSLDYTYSFKKGSNIMTNVDIGKMLSLHPNIIGNCRKSLIEKKYLIKENEDKRIHRLTDKLDGIELPKINDKIDNRECIIPFEIYNNPDLKTGSKLLWGEYNTMRKTEKGYFAKRETTSKRMNVSVGSITNWTKQLFSYDFLEEYEVISGYHQKQKVVRTIEFKREKEDGIDEFEKIIQEDLNKYKSKGANLKIEKNLKEDIVKDNSENKVYSPLFPVKNVTQLHDDKLDITNYNSFENNIEEDNIVPLGGVKRYSELKSDKKNKKNKYIEEEDEEFFNDNIFP